MPTDIQGTRSRPQFLQQGRTSICEGAPGRVSLAELEGWSRSLEGVQQKERCRESRRLKGRARMHRHLIRMEYLGTKVQVKRSIWHPGQIFSLRVKNCDAYLNGLEIQVGHSQRIRRFSIPEPEGGVCYRIGSYHEVFVLFAAFS